MLGMINLSGFHFLRRLTMAALLASGMAGTGRAQTSPSLPVIPPAPAVISNVAPLPVEAAPADQPVPLPLPAAPVKKKKVAKPAPPRETALSNDPSPTLQADTFFSTAKASEHYGAIADAGGWPEIPGPLKPGAQGSEVTMLRLRLAIEGDLKASPGADADQWTPDLTEAVRHFQDRLGLRQTGIVTGATLRELNVPASARYQQLLASAQRISMLKFPFGERYVVVNLPSASVEAVENGTVVHNYIAVVGDTGHPSPEVTARIIAVNLNPTWTVPTSIIKNEIIPQMRKNPDYLTKARIRIFNGKNEEIDPRQINWNSERATQFTLRQDSGIGNSLGNIRIQMPNDLAVYMHDTPAKSLFAADYRFFSHGCVRVQGVYDLAQWLLEGTPATDAAAWDAYALKAAIATEARQDIKLASPVPVAWVYLTGWANRDGIVHFRPDVYGLDTAPPAAEFIANGANPDAPGFVSVTTLKPISQP